LSWSSEPLYAVAEYEDKGEVDGRSTDERGWRDGGAETRELSHPMQHVGSGARSSKEEAQTNACGLSVEAGIVV
jgi:hypothetical protein